MNGGDLITFSIRKLVQYASEIFHVCTHCRRWDVLPYQISHFLLNTNADQWRICRAKLWVQHPLICQNLRLGKKKDLDFSTCAVSNIHELETII